MVTLILFLAAPLFLLSLKSEIDEIKIPKGLNTFSLIILIVLLVIIITPISFIGAFIDNVLFLYCYLFYLIKAITTQYFKKFRIKKIVTLIIICEILTVGFLYISQFTGDCILSRIQPNKITKIEQYRLVHKKLDSDIMYSGTHQIIIHKRIKFIPIIELKIGKVDLGEFMGNFVPSPFKYSVNESNREIIVRNKMIPPNTGNNITKYKY